ncbi:MAG: TM2 domain-containing protein [Phycisphaerales bacterium]
MSTPPTTPMYESTGDVPAKCTRVTYMALAFFLGAFGVHNFVAGHKKKGFIQLGLGAGGFVLSVVLIGIPMILAAAVWALIDMFTVTEDGNGVPFDAPVESYTSNEPLTTGSPIASNPAGDAEKTSEPVGAAA